MRVEPTLDYNRVAALPLALRAFTHGADGWVVGGGAAWLLGLTDAAPRDWDVLVPFAAWPRAARFLPEGSRTNSQGGVKLVCDGVPVDVWPDDLGRFLGRLPSVPGYAVQVSTMTHLAAGRALKRVKSGE